MGLTPPLTQHSCDSSGIECTYLFCVAEDEIMLKQPSCQCLTCLQDLTPLAASFQCAARLLAHGVDGLNGAHAGKATWQVKDGDTVVRDHHG